MINNCFCSRIPRTSNVVSALFMSSIYSARAAARARLAGFRSQLTGGNERWSEGGRDCPTCND